MGLSNYGGDGIKINEMFLGVWGWWDRVTMKKTEKE